MRQVFDLYCSATTTMKFGEAFISQRSWHRVVTWILRARPRGELRKHLVSDFTSILCSGSTHPETTPMMSVS